MKQYKGCYLFPLLLGLVFTLGFPSFADANEDGLSYSSNEQSTVTIKVLEKEVDDGTSNVIVPGKPSNENPLSRLPQTGTKESMFYSMMGMLIIVLVASLKKEVSKKNGQQLY